MLQEAGHIKNTNVLIFRHIQCLHLIYAEVAWVLVSSRTQAQSKIIFDPDYLPDYLSVSYDYIKSVGFMIMNSIFAQKPSHCWKIYLHRCLTQLFYSVISYVNNLFIYDIIGSTAAATGQSDYFGPP